MLTGLPTVWTIRGISPNKGLGFVANPPVITSKLHDREVGIGVRSSLSQHCPKD